MPIRRTVCLGLSGLVLASALTACGTTASTSPPSAVDHTPPIVFVHGNGSLANFVCLRERSAQVSTVKQI